MRTVTVDFDERTIHLGQPGLAEAEAAAERSAGYADESGEHAQNTQAAYAALAARWLGAFPGNPPGGPYPHGALAFNEALGGGVVYLSPPGEFVPLMGEPAPPAGDLPVFISGPSASVPENSISTGYVAQASDPEGGPVVYGLAGGADAALFTIDPGSGALDFITPPDFAQPADANGDNVYEIVLSATAGSRVATRAVQITVTEVVLIGGIAVGTTSTSGYTAGYTLADGDDFAGPLSIVGPQTPLGRYGTTRGSYMIAHDATQAVRGSGGLAAYDVDPQHTGHDDRNRGVPVGSYADMMVQAGGEITLRHRTATPAEQALMHDPSKLALGSMIHTGLSLLGRAPVIFEWREKRFNTVKTHFTGWLMQANGFATDHDLELDFEAGSFSNGSGDGRNLFYHYNIWDNFVRTDTGGPAGPTIVNDQYYTYALRIDENGTATYWLNGSLVYTFTGAQAKALERSFYFLSTAHAYQQAIWSGPDGTITLDWLRVWHKSRHYSPALAGGTYRADFGASASWTLPPATAVWGEPVTEMVEACMQEANEPGGTITGQAYDNFPVGVTYSPGSRELAVSSAVSRPGRLQVVRYVDQPGCTCQPQRILLEVGPRITLAELTAAAGQAVDIDVYPACDVGMILPKVMTVTGLPTGLSFSAATGRITGTAPAIGSYPGITISCTNSSGQSASRTVALTVSAAQTPAPWIGHPDLLADFDGTDPSVMTMSGSNVTNLANKRPGNPGITSAMAAPPVWTPSALNGRGALRFIKGADRASSSILASASTGALVSAMTGTDRPHTIILAFHPLAAVTGFVTGWSQVLNSVAHQSSLVRRAPPSQSSWRNGSSAGSPDVNIGALPEGASHIVAFKRGGGADHVWVNSLTKSMDGVPRTISHAYTAARFIIGSALDNSNMASHAFFFDGYFYRCLLFTASVPDAQVTEAIAWLASDLGITLT